MKKNMFFVSVLLFLICNGSCKKEIPNPVNTPIDTIKTPTILPTYKSDTASLVSATSIAFSAEINPQGLSASYYFEYGTTAGLGNMTQPKDIGSDTTFLSVGDLVANLFPSKLYYYRLTIWTAKGIVTGLTKSINTLSPKSIVLVNYSTSNPTFSTVTVNVNIIALVPVQISFYYGMVGYSQSLSVQAATGINAQTFNLAAKDLLPGSLYHWRLNLWDGNVYNLNTADSTFKTSTDVTNAKAFIFPLTVGASWKYAFYSQDVTSGDSYPYTTGVHTWNVISQSSTMDSTVYSMECVMQDTIISLGGTTIMNTTNPFTIAQSKYITYVNWSFAGDRFVGQEGHLVPRYVQTSTADFLPRPGGENYTNGIGFVSYSFVWTSNETVIEKWTLISFTP